MGREIEFRAWNKYHKKMHSVYEINFDHSIAKTRDNETGGTYTFGFIDLEIMQFTGFVDKNGVKIFEGDIVELRGGKKPRGGERGFYKTTVVFRSGLFTVENNKSIMTDSYVLNICTVIGSIHEHPHLLEF